METLREAVNFVQIEQAKRFTNGRYRWRKRKSRCFAIPTRCGPRCD